MDIVWKRELPVLWDSTDISGKLSLPGLGQLLISTAVEHAEALGFGYRQLKGQNLNWILLRMNFEINRFPEWDETIKLVTWPSGVKGLMGLREFVITDKDEKDLVRVSSEWMIIDLEKRRPKRLNQFTDILKYEKSDKVLKEKLLTPNDKGNFRDLFSIRIRHSDLDLNGHATAKKYFDWINDSLYEVHGDKKIDKFQIIFIHEAYLNEEVTLQVDETLSTIRGIKKGENKPAFMAVVKFKE
jgi:acyl-ACP thioesterase